MGIANRIVQESARLTSLLRLVTDFIVPNTCLTCDTLVERQGGCCAKCWNQFRFVRPPICPVYGTPFSYDMGEGILSAEAIADPPPFERLRCAVLYDDLARQLVSSLKYSDRLDLAGWMASWMVAAGKELLNDADIVIPVPLHVRRLRQRRFNQSAELARLIASGCGVEFRADILLRRRATRQQVGLTDKERAGNVAGAFIVPDYLKIDLKGKRVVLIDDVYTTGSTAKAATRALKRADVGAVDVLVFAKVETMNEPGLYGQSGMRA